MKKFYKGFTLVELLSTISILLVLAVIGIICFFGYLQDAKDSKRLIELDNMVSSIETYQIRGGKLPLPDDSKQVTYSGALVWNQGVFGEGMSKILGYSKLDVVDPNEVSKYTYSVKNTYKEYSIAGVLENDDSLSSKDIVYVNAQDGLKNGNAIVLGNYNGVVTYVGNGDNSYLLALPSIIASDLTSTDLVDIIDNHKLVINGYQNLPASYIGSKFNVDNDLDFSPENLLVYTGSLGVFSDEEQRLSLLYVIQKTYSGSLDNTNPFLNSILENSIDLIYPDKTDLDLACDLVNKKLSYSIDCNYINLSSFYVINDTEEFNTIDFSYLAMKQVNYIYQEGDNLRFGTDTGVYRYNFTSGSWYDYEETYDYKISVIIKDLDGNMWFGTSNSGLLVYDGINFENFQSDYDPPHTNSNHFYPSTTTGIPSNAIYDIILEPSTGNLIIGTHNGGSYYNGDFHDFYVISGNKHYLYSQNRFRSILVDHNGYLWLGTDEGAYLFKGRIDIVPNGPLTTYDGWNGLPYSGNKSKVKVNVIFEDSAYNMRFGTIYGIGKLNYRLNPVAKYTTSTREGLSDNNIQSIFEDPITGNMRFGTNQGVSVFSGGKFTNYTKDIDGIDLGAVFYIYQDENGLNILGTENGTTTVE